MGRQLQQGTGWRLGWDPDASVFKGLVGGEDWAIELTEAELADLSRLAIDIAQLIQQLSAELMDEETIACELESELIWLEAAGYAHAYSLRFILLSGRRGEGAWEPAAVSELLQAFPTFRIF